MLIGHGNNNFAKNISLYGSQNLRYLKEERRASVFHLILKKIKMDGKGRYKSILWVHFYVNDRALLVYIKTNAIFAIFFL